MSKRVYISADYDAIDGDRDVVDELNRWASDHRYKVEFVDMAEVVSGSVSEDSDCRACDLKLEFNRQINASSVVFCIVGKRTAQRDAGDQCERAYLPQWCSECTPYKQNAFGKKPCKVENLQEEAVDGINAVNTYSYLQHEYEQAKAQQKTIVVLYNSVYRREKWLPSYIDRREEQHAFWVWNRDGVRVGDYEYIKAVLGLD